MAELIKVGVANTSEIKIKSGNIVQWGRTALIGERLRNDPRYEEPYDGSPANGYFSGRPIIGSDTHINNGVYLGGSRREAIVIDDQKYPKELDFAYNSVIDSIYQSIEDGESGVKDAILGPVFKIVKELLPYDEAVVRRLTSAYLSDNKVSLNNFIRNNGGVCRHQALLTAYLLERLYNNQELDQTDKISIDRNGVIGRGAHAWVRYISSDGTKYIVDPAQNFIGTLSEAESSFRWPYARPGDE